MIKQHHTLVLYGLRSLTFLGCLILLYGCLKSEQSSVNYGARSGEASTEFETRRDQPPTAKTLYSMADILATQGKDKECEFVLRRCIQQYPQFIPSYNRLAELQMRQGRVHEAIDALSKALQIRPRDPVLLNNLGMCRLIRKDYQKALVHFTEAAGLVPESERYRANMATALGLLGRREESSALLQQILPGDKARHNAEVLRRAHEQEANPAADRAG